MPICRKINILEQLQYILKNWFHRQITIGIAKRFSVYKFGFRGFCLGVLLVIIRITTINMRRNARKPRSEPGVQSVCECVSVCEGEREREVRNVKESVRLKMRQGIFLWFRHLDLIWSFRADLMLLLLLACLLADAVQMWYQDSWHCWVLNMEEASQTCIVSIGNFDTID